MYIILVKQYGHLFKHESQFLTAEEPGTFSFKDFEVLEYKYSSGIDLAY